jgi:hypothetical protein
MKSSGEILKILMSIFNMRLAIAGHVGEAAQG